MINILILLSDQLKEPMGGMGEQARNILACFPIAYKFTVLGSADSEEYSEINFDYYPIMNISPMNGNSEPFSLTYLNQSLFIEKALSLNSTPDIIHAFDWSSYWAGRILSIHYNVPFVVTMQLSIDKENKHPHTLQLLSHQMACAIEMSGLIQADAIIQVSESYSRLFNSFLLPKTSVIHNGINIEEWNKINDVVLPGNNPIKVINIGRFAEMKNVQTLLQCYLPDEIDLIFIGSTKGGNVELFDSKLNFCEATPNAHFEGPKYGQKKVDWLCSADAVIVPSIHEPFGIVALEALASKSILLSSFVNGMADFLTEDCAINCGATKESIELAFEKLLQLKADEKQLMINAGLKVCEEHSWYLQAEKMAKVYESVLSN